MGNIRGHLWAIAGLLLLLPGSTVIASDYGAHKLGAIALREWVLAETIEGRVFSKLLAPEANHLPLLPKTYSEVDSTFETRLGHIEREYLKKTGRETFVEPKSKIEKQLLAELTAEHLGGSRLFEPAKTTLSEKDPSIKKNTDNFASFWKDLRSCKKQMSHEDIKKQNFRYLLSQLGIDEAMTFTGAVIAAGSKPVEWENLPMDLAFEAMASVGGSKLIANTTFTMGWIRLAGFGLGQSSVDATIYYLMPQKELNGKGETEATVDRFIFNNAWSTGYAPIHIGMYHLLTSLECVLANKKGGGAIVLGLQTANELGTNVAYFGVRNYFLQEP